MNQLSNGWMGQDEGYQLCVIVFTCQLLHVSTGSRIEIGKNSTASRDKTPIKDGVITRDRAHLRLVGESQ